MIFVMILGVQETRLKIPLKKSLRIAPQYLFHIFSSFAGFHHFTVDVKTPQRVIDRIHEEHRPTAFKPYQVAGIVVNVQRVYDAFVI